MVGAMSNRMTNAEFRRQYRNALSNFEKAEGECHKLIRVLSSEEKARIHHEYILARQNLHSLVYNASSYFRLGKAISKP